MEYSINKDTLISQINPIPIYSYHKLIFSLTYLYNHNYNAQIHIIILLFYLNILLFLLYANYYFLKI